MISCLHHITYTLYKTPTINYYSFFLPSSQMSHCKNAWIVDTDATFFAFCVCWAFNAASSHSPVNNLWTVPSPQHLCIVFYLRKYGHCCTLYYLFILKRYKTKIVILVRGMYQLFKSSKPVMYFIFFSLWDLWQNCSSQCNQLVLRESWERVLRCKYETLFPFPQVSVETHYRLRLQCSLSMRDYSGWWYELIVDICKG